MCVCHYSSTPAVYCVSKGGSAMWENRPKNWVSCSVELCMIPYLEDVTTQFEGVKQRLWVRALQTQGDALTSPLRVFTSVTNADEDFMHFLPSKAQSILTLIITLMVCGVKDCPFFPTTKNIGSRVVLLDLQTAVHTILLPNYVLSWQRHSHQLHAVKLLGLPGFYCAEKFVISTIRVSNLKRNGFLLGPCGFTLDHVLWVCVCVCVDGCSGPEN